MSVLSEDARAAIQAPRLAHLVTLDAATGGPQVTAVWAGLDGDDIVVAHLSDHRKLTNIRRDDRVAVSIEAEGQTNGMDRYLVVYGRARVTEGGAPDLLRRLAQSYIGPGATFPPPGAPDGYITRIAVDRVAGVGPWKAPAG